MAESRDSKLATPKKAHSHGKSSTLGRAITNIKSYFAGQNDEVVEPIVEITTPTLVKHNPPDPKVKTQAFH